MSRTVMQWVLFFAAAATFPVVFFMFVVAGFLPLSAIVKLIVVGEPFGFKLFSALHLLVYLPIFYFGAKLLARLICLWPAPVNYAVFGAILFIIVGFAFAPIYGVGHSAYHGVNLYQLFRGEMLSG